MSLIKDQGIPYLMLVLYNVLKGIDILYPPFPFTNVVNFSLNGFYPLNGFYLFFFAIKQKETYVKLSESVIMTGNMFMDGCHSSVELPKDKLPEHLRYW